MNHPTITTIAISDKLEEPNKSNNYHAVIYYILLIKSLSMVDILQVLYSTSEVYPGKKIHKILDRLDIIKNKCTELQEKSKEFYTIQERFKINNLRYSLEASKISNVYSFELKLLQNSSTGHLSSEQMDELINTNDISFSSVLYTIIPNTPPMYIY